MGDGGDVIPAADDAARWAPVAKVAYLLVVGAVPAFLAVLVAVGAVERFGPSEVATGAVIERIEGERTTSYCGVGVGRGTRCRGITTPTFSVVGERADGTTWLVAGEGPYDAMRGESGEIEVETSTVTGNVIGLEAPGDDWRVGLAPILFGVGGLVIALPLAVSFEVSRRRHRFPILRPIGRLAPLVVVGVGLGALGAWSAVSRTPPQDLPNTAERYGDLLADPLGWNLALVPAEDDGIVGPDQTMEWSTIDLTVASHDALATPVRAQIDALPAGLTAVVVVRDVGGSPDRSRLEIALDPAGPDVAEACPGDLPPFPTQLGVDPAVESGAVCIPTPDDGVVQLRLVGSLPVIVRDVAVG